MPSPIAEAQRVRARENWMRVRNRFLRRAGANVDSAPADAESPQGRFDQRQQYGPNRDLIDRLTEGLAIAEALPVHALPAQVAGPLHGDGHVRFSASRGKVERYMSSIEEAIGLNKQLPSAVTAEYDVDLMKDLVVLANRKRPGLNAHYVVGVDAFVEKVVDLIARGQKTFRIIVKVTNGIHFVALDVNNEGTRPSVIAIEPSTLGPNWENNLAPLCRDSLAKELPDAAFLIVESGVLSTIGACGMFSFFFVKTMHKEAEALRSLHKDSLSGEFDSSNGLAPGETLPPRFMKHTQSKNRILMYCASSQGYPHSLVNKRGRYDQPGQSVLRRYIRHFGEWEVFGGGKRAFSRSIEVKRLFEYQDLLKAIDEESDRQQ